MLQTYLQVTGWLSDARRKRAKAAENTVMGETLDTMTGSAKTCSFPTPEPACFAPAQAESQLEFNLRRTSFFKELFDIMRLPGHEEGRIATVSEEP